MKMRDEHKNAIQTLKAQIKTAGPVHRRDLIRQLHRMQKELLIYDRYQQQARVARERAAAAAGKTV